MTIKTYWLPISYSVEHREYKRRLLNTKAIRENLPLGIRTVDDVIPVAHLVPAVEADPEPYSNRQSESRTYPTAPYDLVMVDDQIYRPVMLPDGRLFAVDDLDTPAALVDGHKRAGWFADYPLAEPRDRPFGEPFYENVHFNEVRGNDREAKVIAANEVASKLVVWNNLLLRPVDEPVVELALGEFHVTKEGKRIRSQSEKKISIRVLPSVKEATKEGILFGAHEYEEAADLAARVAERLNYEIVFDGELEMFKPDIVRLDTWPRLTKALDNNFEYVAQGGFGTRHTSTALVRQWCDAMDAWTAFRKGVADRDTAARAMLEFMAGFDGHRRAQLCLEVERFATLPELAFVPDEEFDALPAPAL